MYGGIIIKRVAFYTLGCKVNQYETDYIAQIFVENDYDLVGFDEFADIYVINTCTVTNLSDRKSRQLARRGRKINKDSIVAVMGCYSQIEPEKLINLDEIDIVLGTDKKGEILNYIKEFKRNRVKINGVTEISKIKKYEDFNMKIHNKNTRAYIKIQDGCSQYCTYCIIPYVRGVPRSRPQKSVIDEAVNLIKNGYKEIVLTGIHLSSYGKDCNEKLFDLLYELNKLEKLERIRLGSLEPRFIDNEFIRCVSELKKVCPHFHLSLQSGSDTVLKRMNRKYTTNDYINSVDMLRNSFDMAMITTDIIVGFPGESESEFLETVNFIETIKFYRVHVFKYSRREGTKAALMKGQIDSKIKEERSNKLIEISGRLTRMYNENCIGKRVKVLFEQRVKENYNYFEGLTGNYIKVLVETKENLQGKIRDVDIIKTDRSNTIGKLVL